MANKHNRPRVGEMYFDGETQGGKSNQGGKEGEYFVKNILQILKIRDYKSEPEWNFKPINKEFKTKMSPDFVVKRLNSDEYIMIECKFKQIEGSDWEKLENNWGFHEYYYRTICGYRTFRVVVVLIGFWEEKAKNIYPLLLEYAKTRYGRESIFDFGKSVDEIIRFANFININVSEKQQAEIFNLWRELHFKIKIIRQIIILSFFVGYYDISQFDSFSDSQKNNEPNQEIELEKHISNIYKSTKLNLIKFNEHIFNNIFLDVFYEINDKVTKLNKKKNIDLNDKKNNLIEAVQIINKNYETIYTHNEIKKYFLEILDLFPQNQELKNIIISKFN